MDEINNGYEDIVGDVLNSKAFLKCYYTSKMQNAVDELRANVIASRHMMNSAAEITTEEDSLFDDVYKFLGNVDDAIMHYYEEWLKEVEKDEITSRYSLKELMTVCDLALGLSSTMRRDTGTY